ncbi:type II toxin-antitoxin system HicB family antitoxin [Stratiformator vulcanicus]|uniref:HicB-like antitoxin of toxin-antitoxin system domain-containing protein n=1 Tax=Stratiformator vulcanicus TaxID=2527980 RepID=A0A517QX12_9PLAN|nr:type II toxin-antitoxin system HicB family antitoxin [Stratiformator vulcanicus]QDT36134.1 hypothetical protein Pan189_04890 [Stratiformator vulcanicus]
MLNLPYSLIVEATIDPEFFSFYSPDLEGFTGVGHSIEDCLYRARHGMRDHVEMLRENALPIPDEALQPTVLIQNASGASLADATAG